MSAETPSTKKAEKKNDKRTQETSQKAPDRRLVQLNLHSAPAAVKNTIVSEKQPQKKQRSSSSDIETPSGALDVFNDLNKIQLSLQEIQQAMVNKNDVKELVTSIIAEVKSELKNELKQEILTEVKQTMKETLESEITEKVEKTLDKKIDIKAKDLEYTVKEVADGVNLELETLREKFVQQNRELRELKENLKQCQIMSGEALQLANHNHQYSQKNNIKFMGWKETKDEDLRSDLCTILRKKVGIELDPKDVLAIHRLPNGKLSGPRPVIAKFTSNEIKVKVIKKRSNEDLKKSFLMYDHITPRNAKLIRELKEDPRILSAWFYNGKIFALDKDNIRHKFDILDSVSDKVKH